MLSLLAVVAQLLACSPSAPSVQAVLCAGCDTKQPAVLLVASGFADDLPLAEQTNSATLPADHLTTVDQPIPAPHAAAPTVSHNDSATFCALTRSSGRQPLQQTCLPPPRSV